MAKRKVKKYGAACVIGQHELCQAETCCCKCKKHG